MSAARRVLAHAVIAIVLGGHVVSCLFNRQVWPYSPYAMFADARGSDLRRFDTLALVGETSSGEEFWFESQGYLTNAVSPPIIASVFESARVQGPAAVHTRLRETFDLYERLRSSGRTAAPPLRALRLYTFSWTLRPDLANLRTPDRTLVASYTSAETGQ